MDRSGPEATLFCPRRELRRPQRERFSLPDGLQWTPVDYTGLPSGTDSDTGAVTAALIPAPMDGKIGPESGKSKRTQSKVLLQVHGDTEPDVVGPEPGPVGSVLFAFA